MPLAPPSLWQGGGREVDPAGTRAEAAPEAEAVLFRYALRGGDSEFGCAEYLYRDAVSLPALPKRVKAEVTGDAGGAMSEIRFVDADGTCFQWNLTKIDFTAWQPVERALRPGAGGYVAFGPKVKEATGATATHQAFPVKPPFRLQSILLDRRFKGDDGRGAFSLRRLEVEY